MTDNPGELRNVVRLQRQPNIRETVKQALRSAIVSGEMRPGEVYSAPSLGEQFGVSATPVREAMLDLVREGLVTPLNNRGFLVTEVSDRDLEEVAGIRLLLEPPAVECATPRIPPGELTTLRLLADEILVHAERGELVEYLSKDSDLHLTILRYTGNDRLVELVAQLRSQTRLFGLSRLAAQGRLADSAREHHEILAAIAAGDAVAARELVAAHIAHVTTDWSGRDAASDPSSSRTAEAVAPADAAGPGPGHRSAR